MSAMQELQGEAASRDGTPAAEAPAAPAAAPPPAAPATPAGEKPKSEPARPAPAKPAVSPAKAATPPTAKPTPAGEEEKPEPKAPRAAEVKTKQRQPRRPASKGLLRLAVLVLVAGAVYLVGTQTQWGRETTPVVFGWVEGTWAKVTGKPQPVAEPPSLSPLAAPTVPTEADQIVEVTWEGEGTTTLVTVRANGPLTADRVLHEELARPPRSLIRVKGIRRPFTGFQERTDVPNLVGLRVGHHFELHPPELFVVAEPVAGAKVTRVEVSGSTILVEVTVPPTPKPKRRR
jgi:hypothetical protein